MVSNNQSAFFQIRKCLIFVWNYIMGDFQPCPPYVWNHKKLYWIQPCPGIQSLVRPQLWFDYKRKRHKSIDMQKLWRRDYDFNVNKDQLPLARFYKNWPWKGDFILFMSSTHDIIEFNPVLWLVGHCCLTHQASTDDQRVLHLECPRCFASRWRNVIIALSLMCEATMNANTYNYIYGQPRWLSGMRRSHVHSLMIARRSLCPEKLESNPGQGSKGIKFSGWHGLDMSITVTKRR